MTRRTKTPKERAEEALAATLERLGVARERLELELHLARVAHEAAITRRDYLATDPALSSEEESA